MSTLHYIYDPLCGWCYGAAPLLAALRTLPDLHIELHAGGMMTGAQRQAVTPQLRSFVLEHDTRIAKLTGQVFGPAYRDGLLHDATAVLDSEPPITAILAAETLAGHGLDMLKAVQLAHYRDGKKIAEVPVLGQLALALGLDADAYQLAYQQQQGAATAEHIRASRALLAQVGGRGFPTLALETSDGWQLLDISKGLADPQGFVRNLADSDAMAGDAPFCSPTGCN